MLSWQRYCCFTIGLPIESARAGSCTASLASLAATARPAGLADLAGVAGLAGLAYLAGLVGLAPASGHGLERPQGQPLSLRGATRTANKDTAYVASQ